MIWILLLFSLLDFQHPSIPKDAMERNFTVTDVVEQSTTDCTMNPQAPRPMTNEMIEVLWIGEDGKIYDTPMTKDQFFAAIAPGPGEDFAVSIQRVTRPPGEPGPFPDPQPPPVAATPEPAWLPAATLSGILLFALYYLWKKRQPKLVRRY